MGGDGVMVRRIRCQCLYARWHEETDAPEVQLRVLQRLSVMDNNVRLSVEENTRFDQILGATLCIFQYEELSYKEAWIPSSC
jgi:hypothetical protein